MLWTLTITYSWAKPSNLFCNKLPTNSHNLLTPGHKTCRQCSIECTRVSLLPGADLDFTLAQHQLWLRSCLEYSHIKVLLMWLCTCALKLGGGVLKGLPCSWLRPLKPSCRSCCSMGLELASSSYLHQLLLLLSFTAYTTGSQPSWGCNSLTQVKGFLTLWWPPI